MGKMSAKLEAIRGELQTLESDLLLARKGKPTSEGKNVSAETLEKRVASKRTQLAKAELAAAVKEDLKTVALGTSKINYMDPRITIAWCKRNEVPIEKVFNKSLLSKFHWAMDVDWQFRF
ncbi:DNA topoisomerase I [Monoraphidium neglectum]|uniref:DNA topoisomerase I n=1 Tax=Monoraphidium neglectum TaxID=145388 RepID=A0A0D2ME99_9CHLO|nr:DNA topoisomerase I [Monoraphidium neglectum]KIZ01485.1 DNA topoisomerase I [Monoraphidium neglectum]|eukprot:XP_013900504.1 DNA topoisomerase I [Monoraphidium neglectum]